jgi:hypothetical protein
MAFPQKSVPIPIIISCVKKPINILGIAKIAKGNAILAEESCAFTIMGRKPFGSDRKVRKIKRTE